MNQIYLDHAATTPPLPEVCDTMISYMKVNGEIPLRCMIFLMNHDAPFWTRVHILPP